jgi:hypothetical protein
VRPPVRVPPFLLVVLVGGGPPVQAQPDALAAQGVTTAVEALNRAVPFYRDALSKEKNPTR